MRESFIYKLNEKEFILCSFQSIFEKQFDLFVCNLEGTMLQDKFYLKRIQGFMNCKIMNITCNGNQDVLNLWTNPESQVVPVLFQININKKFISIINEKPLIEFLEEENGQASIIDEHPLFR